MADLLRELEQPIGAALPKGWAAAVDEALGQTYYFHVRTGEVTWRLPGPALGPAVTSK